MSLAENLLNSLDEAAYTGAQTTFAVAEEGHIIVNADRTITVPNELKNIAVTGDDDIETVTFDCVRYWDGHDLSTFAIYLNYILPDGTTGTYVPKSITSYDGESFYHFDWEIKGNITQNSGKIAFGITAIKTKLNENGETVVDRQWSSFPNADCSIVRGIGISNVPPEEDAEGIVAQLSAMLEEIQSILPQLVIPEIVQTTGDSEIAVMSQKAVTDEIKRLDSKFIVSEQNLLDVSALKDGYIDISTGLPKSGVQYSFDKYTDFIPVNPSTDYYRSYCNAFLYKADGTYIDRVGGAPGASKFTTTADTAFARMSLRSAYEDLTVAFLSSVRSTYAPYVVNIEGLILPTFGEMVTSDYVLNIAFDTEDRTLTINGFYVVCDGKVYAFEGGVSLTIPSGNRMYFVVNKSTNEAMVIPSANLNLAMHIPVFLFFYNFITIPTANTIQSPYYVNGVCYSRYGGGQGGEGSEKTITLSAGADIQAAINEGYTTIILGAGKYPAKAVTIDGADKIKFIVPDATTSNREQKKNAVIDNSIDLVATYADGMLTAPFTASTSSRWYKVFVSKTYTPIRANLRSESYNAILWETDTENSDNDRKLLPVLTLAECQSTVGSFFYDHTNGIVHINPYDYKTTTVYKRLAVEEGSLFAVKNVNELYMENIEVKYAVGVFELTNISNCTVRNCVVSHTAWASGFSINGVNGSFHGCEAYKACADGFGIGGKLNGYTEYYDCHGHHNYDDGISHHNGSAGAIYGGDWHHNVKGGVAPAHGSVVNCYNVISHDNGYGFYVESDSTVPSAIGRAVKYSGCTAYDNTYGMSVLNYHVVACNCNFEQNITPTKVTNNSTSSLTIV